MTDAFLKAAVIIVLFVIFFQDLKERMVYWFLYPLVGGVGYVIHASNVGFKLSLLYSFINLALITVVLIILMMYSRIKMKMDFINGAIGLGDILLLVFLSFIFPTVTFIVLFVFSLFFSLLVHHLFKKDQVHKNVPLAGYIALFFLFVYIASFILEPHYLYS